MAYTNADISTALEEIASFYTHKGDSYREGTYHKAALNIKHHPKPITSGRDALTIRGVGKSVSADIDEFLQTGHISRLEALRREFQSSVEANREEKRQRMLAGLAKKTFLSPPQEDPKRKAVVDLFMTVWGIGPRHAREYYDKGYRTLEELQFAPLTTAARLGLKYYEEINQRIPRKEMDKINQAVEDSFRRAGINPVWEIVGSYRRQEPESGDVDILVRKDPNIDMDSIISALDPYIIETLAEGPTTFRGIMRYAKGYPARRLDIKFVPPKSYVYGLMHTTGSDRFNVLMRQRALKLGLELNEYRLMDKGTNTILGAETEDDIFRHLGVKYLAPEERTRTISSLPLRE